jgi:serine/threonine protein kinase
MQTKIQESASKKGQKKDKKAQMQQMLQLMRMPLEIKEFCELPALGEGGFGIVYKCSHHIKNVPAFQGQFPQGLPNGFYAVKVVDLGTRALMNVVEGLAANNINHEDVEETRFNNMVAAKERLLIQDANEEKAILNTLNGIENSKVMKTIDSFNVKLVHPGLFYESEGQVRRPHLFGIVVMELLHGEDLYEFLGMGRVRLGIDGKAKASKAEIGIAMNQVGITNIGAVSTRNFGVEYSDRAGIALDFLLGLEQVHQKDLVHLDLKPDNVVLDVQQIQETEYIRTKIIDFGLSEQFIPATGPRELGLRGTRGYMAPEYLLEQPMDLQKIDVFAAGMTVADIFLGQFEGWVVGNDKGNPLMIAPEDFMDETKRNAYFTRLNKFASRSEVHAPEKVKRNAPQTQASFEQIIVGKLVWAGMPSIISTAIINFLRRFFFTNPTERWTIAQAVEEMQELNLLIQDHRLLCDYARGKDEQGNKDKSRRGRKPQRHWNRKTYPFKPWKSTNYDKGMKTVLENDVGLTSAALLDSVYHYMGGDRMNIKKNIDQLKQDYKCNGL